MEPMDEGGGRDDGTIYEQARFSRNLVPIPSLQMRNSMDQDFDTGVRPPLFQDGQNSDTQMADRSGEGQGQKILMIGPIEENDSRHGDKVSSDVEGRTIARSKRRREANNESLSQIP